MSGFLNTFVRAYQKHASHQMARFGLKFEDLIVHNEPVKAAISWLPKQEATNRTRRIVRALDMSFKRTELPAELREIQNPRDFYLKKYVDEATKLYEERKALTRW